MRHQRCLLSAVCLLLLTLQASQGYCENYGFGGLVKHSVTVERRLAPDFQLSNASISVVFPHGGSGLDERRFSSQLESDIVRGGQNIFLQQQNPLYEIRIEVTSFDRPHVQRDAVKNGTTYTPVGSATVVYQLVHHADGKVIVAGNESYRVASTGHSLLGVQLNGGANQNTTDDSVALQLINNLAIRVASHLVVTGEELPLLLAKGPGLDEANKLALARRWDDYLQALTLLPPAPAPADDAYRLYDLGVANEALGYAAEDPKTTLKYLDAASIDYSRALEDRNSEKYFSSCQDRIEKALARYTALKQRDTQAQQLKVADQRESEAYAARKRAGVIDNTDVIRLVQAGVDPAIILSRIRTAPSANFDLTTDGLVELSHAGVKAPLINEMMQRMQPAGAPTAGAGSPARR